MTFLAEPDPTPQVQALYDADVQDHGYVMNLSRAWAHHPDAHNGLFVLIADVARAGGVLTGADARLSEREQAMASWARRVAADANGTTSANVDGLRDAGLDDTTIFAVTAFVALRMAFSTVNGALGAVPDAELWETAPTAVAEAVTWGR